MDFGGLERVVINLVCNLDKSKYQCDVLCLRSKGRFADEITASGSNVHCFEMGRGKSFSIPIKLGEFIKNGRYDVVQSHDTTPLLYVALAKVFYPSFRHVYTEHSGIYSCYSRHRIMTWCALASASHAVMVSQDLLSYYRRYFPLTKHKSSVIYNGLDFPVVPSDARHSVCSEFNVPFDVPIVGTAVRFYPQKGLQYLIQAIPHVLSASPDTRFLLVGDGVERRKLELLVDELGIRDRVIFAGFRKDISRLVGAMDVYVLPSLWEGLPLALIEALMAGKAVVATKVGGNSELIEDGRSGFVVPPGDSASLAEKLITLVGSAALRQQMSERGYAFVHEHFALQRMVSSYEDLYLDITHP